MTKELWSEEYARQGIPSSFRKEATKVVMQTISLLAERGIKSGMALDLGCGKGRNAFFLAANGFDVIALDFVSENVAWINATAKEVKIPIHAHCQSVVDPWPVRPDQVDFAIDIFCYKHIVDKNGQAKYRQNLISALKKGGYYLISLAADDDGFYGPLLSCSPDIKCKAILDPYSHIGSFLYSLDEIIAEFSGDFIVVKMENARSVSPMHGKEYPRSVLNVLFQKA